MCARYHRITKPSSYADGAIRFPIIILSREINSIKPIPHSSCYGVSKAAGAHGGGVGCQDMTRAILRNQNNAIKIPNQSSQNADRVQLRWETFVPMSNCGSCRFPASPQRFFIISSCRVPRIFRGHRRRCPWWRLRPKGMQGSPSAPLSQDTGVLVGRHLQAAKPLAVRGVFFKFLQAKSLSPIWTIELHHCAAHLNRPISPRIIRNGPAVNCLWCRGPRGTLGKSRQDVVHVD